MYTYSSKTFAKKDFKALKKKSKAGDPESQYLLATYYGDGLVIDNKVIVVPDEQKAFKWTTTAYENGSGEALIRYANYLADGGICEKDQRTAIALYKKAISNQDALGAVNLGRVYSQKGMYAKAFENYLLAEKMGHHCSVEIGLSHYFGLGTDQNIRKAIACFKSVLSNEDVYSFYEVEEVNFILGKLYLEGIHIPKSVSKAIQHLEKANADNAHRSARELLLLLKESI